MSRHDGQLPAPVQDLREHRRQVQQLSLRNAVLPPDLAASKSTTAAIELKQAG